MKNDNDDQAINGGEQTPEVLAKNLNILGEDVIEFSVKNMSTSQSGDVKETGISFKPDEHGNAIGVIKPQAIDGDNVRRALIEIDKTVNILSLLYNVGDWRVRMRRVETYLGRVMNSERFARVDDFIRSISEKMNNEEMEIYFRALDWYRHGIISNSIFDGFLAFYNSVELFSDGYYSKHKSEIRKTPTEKDECIKKYFSALSITSISEIERKHINDCFRECLETSSKDKMIFTFKNVFDGNEGKINIYSDKFLKDDPNFKSIRNDIAHGNFSEFKEADRLLVKTNLSEIQYMANEFLIKIIS